MIALWIIVVILAAAVGYGLVQLKQIEDVADQTHDDVRGLAGDIVSLGFLIRLVTEQQAEIRQTTKNEEDAA